MSDKPDKQPILVPVDFSPHAEAALVHAANLAECLQRPLVVLHVVHDPGEMPGYYARSSRRSTWSGSRMWPRRCSTSSCHGFRTNTRTARSLSSRSCW